MISTGNVIQQKNYWAEPKMQEYLISAPGNDRFLSVQMFPLLATTADFTYVAVQYRCTDEVESYVNFYSWTKVGSREEDMLMCL